MKPSTLTCAAVLAICLAASAQAAIDPRDPALAAAEAWLKVKDAGNFDATWNQSSRFFKQRIAKDTWKEGGARVQLYLGKVLSRKVKSVDYMDRSPIPDLPPGKHAIVTFDTVFERTGAMVEVVGLMLEDGTWRVTVNS
jgi:hypothetical protein